MDDTHAKYYFKIFTNCNFPFEYWVSAIVDEFF